MTKKTYPNKLNHPQVIVNVARQRLQGIKQSQILRNTIKMIKIQKVKIKIIKKT